MRITACWVWLCLVCGTSAALASEAPRVQWLNDSVSAQSVSALASSPAYLCIRRIRYDSIQTTIHCSVLDRDGEPVSGLQASDFRLAAGGLALAPTDFGVMADRADQHLVVVVGLAFADEAVLAPRLLSALAGAFVTELEESKRDLCALLTFRGRIEVPRLFSSDPLLLKDALASIHFSGEGISLNAALDAARTLIRQHDTTGYGVVVAAFDDDRCLDSLPDLGESAVESPGDFPVYALGIALAGQVPGEKLGRFCQSTGGEAFLASGDTLSMLAAAGQIIRILQGQYVIRTGAPVDGWLRLDFAGHGASGQLSDSVFVPAEGGAHAPARTGGLLHPRLVGVSLLVGVLLLALVLALHVRNRA